MPLEERLVAGVAGSCGLLAAAACTIVMPLMLAEIRDVYHTVGTF